ncbi:hypothetical protein GFM44_23190 [Rhizobium leguminosarum bv. viciae]|nr:hypothetical protein [Rhizobium leguminosarum bv. viciae]
MKFLPSLFRSQRPSAKERLQSLEREVERLRAYNAKLAGDVAKVTRERDAMLFHRSYASDQMPAEFPPTVDEAFTRCSDLVNSAAVVMIGAVDHFCYQMEVITDLEGYEPRELTMARDRVVDLFNAFLKNFHFDADSGTLRSIHLNARTAERIAGAVREGEYHPGRCGNHLKVIK